MDALIYAGVFVSMFAGALALSMAGSRAPSTVPAAFAAWCEEHGVAPDRDVRFRVGGIPIRAHLVPLGVLERAQRAASRRARGLAVRIEARYATGRGPAFALASRGAPAEPMLRQRLVTAIRHLARGRGDVEQGTRLLVSAIERGDDLPLPFPHVEADGARVVVTLPIEGLEATSYERLASIAASLAGHELVELGRLATGLDAEVEVEDDGLAVIRVAGAVPLRIVHRRIGGASAPTTIEASVAPELPELCDAPFRLTRVEDAASQLGRRGPSVAAALVTLAGLGGADVDIAPRGVRVAFAALPSSLALRSAAGAVQALVLPDAASPFR